MSLYKKFRYFLGLRINFIYRNILTYDERKAVLVATVVRNMTELKKNYKPEHKWILKEIADGKI